MVINTKQQYFDPMCDMYGGILLQKVQAACPGGIIIGGGLSYTPRLCVAQG